MAESLRRWSDKPVPEAWRGAWRRLELLTPGGVRDTTTNVTWLQGEHAFGDIRLPDGRPSFDGIQGFGELSRAQALFLASQEGFAGMAAWCGDTLWWRRAIDFRPLEGPPDRGRLAREGDVLVERGLKADYVEYWRQELNADVVRDSAARIDAGSPQTWWIRVADHLVMACDNRPATPPVGGLGEHVSAAIGDPKTLAALLDCEVSLARRTPDGAWQIAISTLPWREGTTVPAGRVPK